MKTNYRRAKTKARRDQRRSLSPSPAAKCDLKRDSTRLDRHAPLPAADDEDERPRAILYTWLYF